jgi:two-component system, NarL family, response regulator LiaR
MPAFPWVLLPSRLWVERDNHMVEPISVLLVDDHNMVRMGLKAFFNTLADIQVVGEAGTGEEALKLAADLAPDVVLMDLIMPGMDGVEATRRVKSASPRTQVIVLTSYHDDEHIFPAIRAGALSYVLKDIDPDELADAVRRAHAGEAVLNPRVAARLVKEMHGIHQEVINPFQELTERELDVLRQIAAGKSNREIAEALVISEKTVKSHITNILSKLHLADRTQAAVYAWQEGIVRRDRK